MIALRLGMVGLGALLLGGGCGPATPDSGGSKGEAKGARAMVAGEPFNVVSASGVEMVAVPGGEFQMGSARGNPDEGPVHKVALTAFLIDKFEVTQEMFARVQLPNPSRWNERPKHPVERVRWRDAKQYCNERSLAEGLKTCYDEKTPEWTCNYAANGYRLPTEAEWEYACRAGTEGDYDFGAVDKLRQFAWCADNAEERTHPAGQKKPNRWGIHDLYGNVAEWCEDVYQADYYRSSPLQDPTGPPSAGKDTQRVLRGGSWKASAAMSRATFRQGQRTGDADACFYTDYCGFRCVRRPDAGEWERLRAAAK